MRKWWIIWPLYAGLMGFALGASFFFGMYGRTVTESSIAGQHEQQSRAETTKSKKAENDEALAFYTLWLMAFTGILAFATIGLGGATVLLYATGEKQFKFAIRSNIRQSRDTKASIAAAIRSADIAEKALLSVEIPYLYPFIRRHGFIRSPSKLTGQLGVVAFDFGSEFIEYYFKNFGRTPAEIIEVQSILLPSIGMPNPWPSIDHNMNPLSGHIVAADGGESQDFHYAFNQGMFETYSLGKFNPDASVFYFLGFVRYNDVFENEYVRGFCLRYAPMTNSFYPVGGEGYNYRRKIKTAEQQTQDQ